MRATTSSLSMQIWPGKPYPLVLIDPYAKALDGEIDGHESLFSYCFDDAATFNDKDSLGHTMTSVVINPWFDWEHDRPPQHDYHESIIYEAHIKGLTMTHPEVPEEIRGSYAAVAHPAIVEHLTSLGITAIELMPVHQFMNDPDLVAKGLSNYWGYNTIGFFAPHAGYARSSEPGAQVQEFKSMVKALHQANIEVILDVVYNHTAEGNHLGPTLSFRGIDNGAYYRLVDEDPRHYFDTTGTGNSLLMRHPHVLQLIMDSLRYWVEEMRVDGFRFDLASTLARQFHEVDQLSTFFQIIQQDPVLSQVKLIAEPWDIGDGGYQVGGFPPLWTEWNGDYRDTVRDFWRSEPGTLAEFARRLSGSADLYEHSGRKPIASINFITAHDGFGDELGRTQGGNNNGYCQDNPITWIDWNLSKEEQAHLDFTRQLIHLRRRHPSLRRRRFLHGTAPGASKPGDSAWYNADGTAMTDDAWNAGHARTVMMYLNGEILHTPDTLGRRLYDDSFLFLFNAWHEPVIFTLPEALDGTWRCAIDTDHNMKASSKLGPSDRLEIHGRSTVVLKCTRSSD